MNYNVKELNCKVKLRNKKQGYIHTCILLDSVSLNQAQAETEETEKKAEVIGATAAPVQRRLNSVERSETERTKRSIGMKQNFTPKQPFPVKKIGAALFQNRPVLRKLNNPA